MRLALLIAAMGLPDKARVDRRIPKKMLLEQGKPTAADRRQIQDGVEELIWVAALKPSGIGIAAFRDEARNYEEIAVLTVALRSVAKPARVAELIHRAIPYPLVLVMEQDGAVLFSVAHKRLSQAEVGKTVVERVEMTAPFAPDKPSGPETAFLNRLDLSRQSGMNLYALYQGWVEAVTALAASRITGGFRPTETPEQAAARRAALDEYAALDRDIALLRAKAEKEKQLDRLVELNMEIKGLQARMNEIRKEL